MQVHLSRPGGQREGPYTVEEINRDLAVQKYRDTDYWAWYEGLEAWVPLHAVPGVVPLRPSSAPPPPTEPQETPIAAEMQPAAAPSGSKPKSEATPPQQITSGMPAAALEHIFIFTSGEGPSTMQSPVTGMMLQEITGEELGKLRERVPRDVFGRCDIGQRLRKEGAVPDAAWKAMSALKPEIVKRAHEGHYRICVRTFNVQPEEVVAAFLFYDKQKL